MDMGKFKYIVLAGLVAAAVATTFVVMKPRSPVTPLPNPNGYNFFVKAARMLGPGSADLDQLDAPGLRALVSQNAGALKVARQGFEYESRIADFDATNMLDVLSSLKHLAWAFSAEGKLAELENRREDAIRSYLDDVRLGQESTRGGPVIVRLVGIALEGIGLRSLQPLAQSAGSNQCRQTALALESLDAKEPPLAETLAEEDAYAAKVAATQPITMALVRLIHAGALNKMKAPFINKVTGQMQVNQLTLRQTMIVFAARAYELEKKQGLKNLGDLTPGYLKVIPKDPRTGKVMVDPP
jgi:hypothetical protein